MERKNLTAGRLYYIVDTELYFYTPDGVGGYFYDTRSEVIENHGDLTIYTIDSLED